MFKQDTRNDVLDTVIANDGGSFTFAGEPVSLSEGFAVSLPNFGVVTNVNGLSGQTLDSLADSVLKRVEGLADPQTHMIGMWVDGDTLHVDLTVIVSNREDAIAKAKQNDQIAIWDYSTDSCITV